MAIKGFRKACPLKDLEVNSKGTKRKRLKQYWSDIVEKEVDTSGNGNSNINSSTDA